jgi:hypothetical protein
MILSVHQPNFIPWIGYFNKIVKSDVFVILDIVQIPRGTSVANKNKIISKQGVLELVVPISHPKGNNRISTYKEVFFSEKNWYLKSLKTIESVYQKAPFYNDVMPFIKQAFEQEDLYNLNIFFISDLCKQLNIKTEIVLMSDLKDCIGSKNELILSICKEMNATTYLSGKGAASYNDPLAYHNAGIQLVYQEYEPMAYKQFNSTDFIANLSIVDALFNLGFEGTSALLIAHNLN